MSKIGGAGSGQHFIFCIHKFYSKIKVIIRLTIIMLVFDNFFNLCF